MNSDQQLEVKKTDVHTIEYEKDVQSITEEPGNKLNNVNGPKKESPTWIIAVLFIFLNLIISMISTYYVSIQWVWAIYLSPILTIQILILYLGYNRMLKKYDPSKVELNKKFEHLSSQAEQSFGKVSLLLPLLLLFWSIFIIIYSTVFNGILKISLQPVEKNNFTSSYGDIIYSNTVNFQQENYTILLINFQFEQKNMMGYGCVSNLGESSVMKIHPRPYQFYQLEIKEMFQIEEAVKLPSWFCAQNINTLNSSIIDQTYMFHGDLIGKPFLKLKNDTMIENLVLFDDTVYMPLTCWIVFIILVYQQLLFFTCVLLYIISYFYHTFQVQTLYKSMKLPDQGLTNLDEFNKNRQTQYQTPSNFKRSILIMITILQMFSLLDLLLQIGLNQNEFKFIFIGLLVLPGFIIWIATFCSFYQQTVLTLIKLLYTRFKTRVIEGFKSTQISDRIFSIFLIFMIPICFILLRLCYLLCSVYFILSVINLRLYLSRHFVSYWIGIEEKKLTKKEYDKFISKFYIFDGILRGPILLTFLTIFQSQQTRLSYSFYIVYFFTLLEILMMVNFIFHGLTSLIYDKKLSNNKQALDGVEEGITMFEKVVKQI